VRVPESSLSLKFRKAQTKLEANFVKIKKGMSTQRNIFGELSENVANTTMLEIT